MPLGTARLPTSIYPTFDLAFACSCMANYKFAWVIHLTSLLDCSMLICSRLLQSRNKQSNSYCCFPRSNVRCQSAPYLP